MTARRSCVKVLLSTSVCPSVWGWQVVENNSFVPNLPHNTFQKYLRNLTSLLDTMLRDPMKPYYLLKNKSIMLVASSVLWHGIKCAIFENLSTTTKIESLPCLDLGKPKMKSIEMSNHGSLGTGKRIYKPCGWVLELSKMPYQPAAMCFTYKQFTHKN